jgi:hypothetical protein
MLKISTKHLPKKKDLEFVHVPVNQIHAYLYVLVLVNVQQIIPRMRKVIHLKENVGKGALLQELIVWHHLLLQRHERDAGGLSLALTMSTIMVWLVQRVLTILDVIRK